MSYTTQDALTDLNLEFELALHTENAEHMFTVAEAIKQTGDDEWAEEARQLARRFSDATNCAYDLIAHD